MDRGVERGKGRNGRPTVTVCAAPPSHLPTDNRFAPSPGFWCEYWDEPSESCYYYNRQCNSVRTHATPCDLVTGASTTHANAP